VGRVPIAGLPGARLPGEAGAPAISPAIGEHSRAVLTELGLAAAEIDALLASGTVVEAKPAVPA
jgi:crotonobetainyl-CoA:carnitine CoA-transferase CaiB-like acyl-CoA transferase